VQTSLVGSFCVDRSPVVRQGFLDRPIFIVPIVSCALAIFFFGFMLGQLFAQRSRSRSTAMPTRSSLIGYPVIQNANLTIGTARLQSRFRLMRKL
jgi:hypothetical protein